MKFNYLLILRYILVNSIGLAFLLALLSQGYVKKAFEADVTNMILVIIGLFAIGFITAFLRTLWISKELNQANSSIPNENSLAAEFINSAEGLDASSRSNLAASLRIKLSTKINHIKFIANTLVILGLIGTVIGFIIALSGVDGSGVSSDPEEVSKMVAVLISGMSVALYTTLAGSICSVWLNLCYQILSTGANRPELSRSSEIIWAICLPTSDTTPSGPVKLAIAIGVGAT